MKPECFRLASALTNASPFKSSVPTARTIEAISMHLPARDMDSVCTRTEMATCLSLLVPVLSPLFSLHHFHICENALITPRSRMILATSSETEWGGRNSNLHYRFSCLLTLVYGLHSRKEQKRVSRNGDTWKSTPQILHHQGSRNHSTKRSHRDGDKWPNHSVGSTCPFYF